MTARGRRGGSRRRRGGNAIVHGNAPRSEGKFSEQSPLNYSRPSSSASSEELVQSRSHLKGVSIIQKNSVVVHGLPKDSFHSTKAVQEKFGKYGKICKCVIDPRGLPPCEIISIPGNKRATVKVYITYLNEKCALNAIRETDQMIVDGSTIRSTLATTRYCDEFLQGKHCQDLSCVLLHEMLKDRHVQRRDHSGRICSANLCQDLENMSSTKVFTPSYVSRDSVNDKRLENTNNCWSTPRNFLHAATGFVTPRDLSSTCGHIFIKSKEYRDEKVLERDDAAVFQFRTPNSSPPLVLSRTQIIKGEKKPMTTSDQTGFVSIESGTSCGTKSDSVTQGPSNFNEHIQTFHSVTNYKRDRRSYSLDLPARQLFKSNTAKPKNCAVSPPKEKSSISSVLNGFDNPWGFQSPIMIGDDNFSPSSPNECKEGEKIEKGEIAYTSKNYSSPKDKLDKDISSSPTVTIGGKPIGKACRKDPWTGKESVPLLPTLTYREKGQGKGTFEGTSKKRNGVTRFTGRDYTTTSHQLFSRQSKMATDEQISPIASASVVTPSGIQNNYPPFFPLGYHVQHRNVGQNERIQNAFSFHFNTNQGQRRQSDHLCPGYNSYGQTYEINFHQGIVPNYQNTFAINNYNRSRRMDAYSRQYFPHVAHQIPYVPQQYNKQWGA